MSPDKKPHPPRASRDRFDAVFRLAPIGIVMVGLDGRVLAVNPAMSQMLGYEDGELLGRSILDFTARESATATMELLRGLMDPESGGAGTVEKNYVHKQGHAVWGLTSVHLHRDAKGAPDLFVAHVQDISERRRREAVLRESEEKFRIAFDNAPVGMSIINPTGRFLAVNPTLCQMFGYSAAELTAGTFNDITHPGDIERGMRWAKRRMGGDHSEPELEKRYLHKNGQVVWGLVRAQWVRNPDGSPRMAVVHIVDITERKRAEEALLQRERQLREAHSLAGMGHWSLDLASGEARWADGMFRLLELDPATTSPSAEVAFARIYPEDVAMVREALRAATHEQRPTDHTFRLRFSDGRVKHMRGICHPERDGDGQVRRVTGVLQDITRIREAEEERRQLEEQLQQSRRMEAIGFLAGGIAHDFNNLLTVIGGNASLALLDTPPESRLGALLSEITQAVGSGAQLTRQLLAFSRKQVIEPKVMNLNERIEQLTPVLRRLLGEDLELETTLDPHIGQVRFDLGQAEQVLINLAVNARDAMQDGGKLTLRTANVELDGERDSGESAGGYVLLEVTDTGSGMSEETKQHLFEPFFTTKEPGRGTGLGLATVFGSVEQNQGHIRVSSAPGRGSTFRIYLPRVEAPVDPAHSVPAPDKPAGSETILLVEDDPAVRALGERVLVRQGYEVRSCASGPEALAAVREGGHRLDLLVTDVIMPGMNGRTLADELRRSSPALKVLFTSGYTQDVIGRRGVLEEGVEFLPKPYSFEDLARKVRKVLG